MSIEAGIHPNAGGWGGRKPRLIPAILTFILIACNTIMGCNGHSNPLDVLSSMDIERVGQSFLEPPSEWGTGYSLDSASTIWVDPLPSEDIQCGDIAMEDIFDEEHTVCPFVTAVVRQSNTQATSEVYLKLIDESGTTQFSDNFGAEAGPGGSTFCKHPAVEVTYSREEGLNGVLRVHVVWSEFTDYVLYESWDIWYRYLEFDVTESGINWTPTEDEIVDPPNIRSAAVDEIEPDICVLAYSNDVIIIFVRYDDSSGTWNVMSSYHDGDDMDDPDSWTSPSYVSGSSGSVVKWAPAIDAGPFSYVGGISTVPPHCIALWTELESTGDYDDWQIYYKDWQAPSGSGCSAFAITGGTEDEINYLPQVDIVGWSGDFSEAVIVWDSATWDDEEEEFVDYHVKWTATPEMDDEEYHVQVYDDGGWSRCSDVACYQRTDDDQTAGEEWFVISYHQVDDPEEDWEVWAQNYSFDANINYTEEYLTYVTSADAQWKPTTPFTGTTICLRDPYKDVDDGAPIDETFGLAWIDRDGGDDYDVLLTRGIIP